MAKLIFFISLLISFQSFGYRDYRSLSVKDLEDSLFILNNQGEFVKSYKLIEEFRKNVKNTVDDEYFSLLFLSYLHKRLSDYDKVQMYLDSAGGYVSKTSNPEQFGTNQKCQKSFAFFDVQDYELAERLMLEIEQDVESNLSQEDLSMYFMQQGYIYFLSNNYDLAEKKLKRSEAIMSRHLPEHLPIVCTKLMQLYAQMGKDSLMILNFNQSLELANKYGIKKYYILTYQVRKDIAKDKADFDAYLKYDLLFDQSEKDYNADQHQLEILEIEKQYAIERKANELEQSKQKYRWLVYFSGFIFLALLIVLIFWWRVTFLSKRLKSQHKDLTLLDKLNKEIFSVISHDLKEPLISIRFFLDEIKNKGKSNTEEIIADLESQVQITSAILQDLLTWSAVELRISTDENVGNVNLKHIVNESLEHFNQAINRKNINVNLNLTNVNDWKIDPWVCSIVMRNLLSNAIKFSEMNGEINVVIKEDSISIVDNGIGIEQSVLSSKFDSRENPNYGTSGESGFGIGLYLSQTLLSRNGFHIVASSNAPKGAVFQIIKSK